MKQGVFALAMLLAASSAWAGDDDNKVSGRLSPSSEVPAVSSPAARGSFKATLDETTQTIDYELKFEGLQSDITQSHIHFAQKGVNGAIVIWLCRTAATPTAPPSVQLCSGPRAGTISGTISLANILTATPAPTQGLPDTLSAADRFARILAGIRDGLTYVNVHTAQSPGGEIRAQLKADD